MNCPIHNVEARKFTKNGSTWYSHLHEGEWCNSRNWPSQPSSNESPSTKPIGGGAQVVLEVLDRIEGKIDRLLNNEKAN